MARVSFEAVKRFFIALGWVVLFAFTGGVVTLVLSRYVPIGGVRSQLVRDVVYSLIGFIIATVVVARLLAKASWDRLGWHRPIGPRVVNGALVGLVMAAVAIGL